MCVVHTCAAQSQHPRPIATDRSRWHDGTSRLCSRNTTRGPCRQHDTTMRFPAGPAFCRSTDVVSSPSVRRSSKRASAPSRMPALPVGELQPALAAPRPWELDTRCMSVDLRPTKMQAQTITPSLARDMLIATAALSLAMYIALFVHEKMPKHHQGAPTSSRHLLERSSISAASVTEASLHRRQSATGSTARPLCLSWQPLGRSSRT